ncbi:MAG: hypothetical protein IJZ23_08445 [Roseburia sp.]|nr:hypothetical protein [Roseburia sp.]
MEGTTTFSFTEVFGWITEGIQSVLSVCTEFPLNIFIGASVIGIGVGIYKSLKH